MKWCLLLFLFGVSLAPAYGAGGSVGGTVETEEDVDGANVENESYKRAVVGYRLQLDCSSLNTTELKWKFNPEQDTIIIREADKRLVIANNNSTLQIQSVKKEDLSHIQCIDKNDETKFKDFHLYELKYKMASKSTVAQEGDRLTLVCDVDGTPKPTIAWYKDQKPIQDAINGTDRIRLSANDHGIDNGVLKVEEITDADHGYYSCLMSIDDNLVRNATTHVRVKSIYAALWPFLGIVAEVVILCIVIFIYERKRIKNDYDESDNDAGTDQ